MLAHNRQGEARMAVMPRNAEQSSAFIVIAIQSI